MMSGSVSNSGNLIIKIVFLVLAIGLLLSVGVQDSAFLTLSIINCAFAVIAVFSDPSRPFSIHKQVNIFVLLFFVFANSIQFANGSSFTSVWVVFSKADYQLFQSVVLLVLLLYNIVYYSILSRKSYYLDLPRECSVQTNEFLLLIIAFFAGIVVLYHFREDYSRLFVRGFQGDLREASIGGQSLSLLFDKFIRVFPLSCLLVASLSDTKRITKVLLLLITLITLFPSGLARNAIILYWLPIALVHIRLFEKRFAFTIIMLLGILVVFPFFDSFRYYNGELHFKSISFDYLDTMNYDASQQFMTVIKLKIITFGKQLLGVLLFFIPRSIWPSKPVGSGAYVAQSQFEFSNVSMPFWGEGYINFGWLGVIAFTLFLAWLSASLDSGFWSHKHSSQISVDDGYYLFVLSSMIFLLRGDLMSSFAFLVGALISYMVVLKITTRSV